MDSVMNEGASARLTRAGAEKYETRSTARLEFVLREIKGQVPHLVHVPPPTKAQREKNPELETVNYNRVNERMVPAGYMLYLPTGQMYRLSPEEAKKRGFLDREPKIIGLEQVSDTTSPAGKFKFGRTERIRENAYRAMEQEIINRCLGKVGSVEGVVTGLVPNDKKEAA